MSDGVVMIDGSDCGDIHPMKPSKELIEHLEQMLAEARSGEIQEIITAAIHHDKAVSWGNSGATLDKFTLSGAAMEAVRVYMENRA
jgi:hypothetical protein